MLTGLCLGRTVHYVLAPHDLSDSHKHCAGQVVPAIVVNDWPQLNRDDGYANLQAFTDGSNHDLPPVVHLCSRTYSETYEPGTWHWPPRVTPEQQHAADPKFTDDEDAKQEAGDAAENGGAETSQEEA